MLPSFQLLIYLLIAAQNAPAVIGELKSRAVLRDHQATVQALAINQNGTTLASADESGAILIWDLKTLKKLRALNSLKKVPVLTLSMSSDGRTLISAHADKLVRIWDLQTGELKNQLTVDALSAARITPDGKTIICTRSVLADSADDLDHVWLVDPQTGVKRAGLDVDFEFVSDAVLSPDGAMLAVSGGESLTDTPAEKGGRQRDHIELWDLKANPPKLLRRIADNTSQPLLCPTFSGGGKLLAAVARDWLVFETAGGNQVATLHATEFRARSCAISPNVRWIATGSIDSTVALVDTHTWKIAFQSKSDAALDVTTMCFTPDGDTLISSRGKLIELFDIPQK